MMTLTAQCRERRNNQGQRAREDRQGQASVCGEGRGAVSGPQGRVEVLGPGVSGQGSRAEGS